MFFKLTAVVFYWNQNVFKYSKRFEAQKLSVYTTWALCHVFQYFSVLPICFPIIASSVSLYLSSWLLLFLYIFLPNYFCFLISFFLTTSVSLYLSSWLLLFLYIFLPDYFWFSISIFLTTSVSLYLSSWLLLFLYIFLPNYFCFW